MGGAAGRLLALALLAGPAGAGTLVVESGGAVLARAPLPDGAEWCLTWNHSVTGGDVADCFGNAEGAMVLRRSYLHDFAAGLGEVPGRGTIRPAARGGYWIEGIDERVEPLVLRVGRRETDHRIRLGDGVIPLSRLAPGARVTIRVAP